MSTEKNRNDRPFAYPKPTETDQQLKNQPEFVDQQPNKKDDEQSMEKPASGNEKKLDRERE